MANAQPPQAETRVAVLVDCDNTSPEVLEHALRVVAQFGRVVLRRGYGNHATLANKWQEALEALFDDRADTFCLVTSDSDFAYLCRKLRERGATVHIVGEAKTPDALRNASDQFFEWTKPTAAAPVSSAPAPALKPGEVKPETTKPDAPKPAIKRRPLVVVEAVRLLASDSPEGKVHLGGLGQYLKRTDPAFSPQTYGHSGLLDMLRTYDLLALQQEPGGHWSVRLVPQPDTTEPPSDNTAAPSAHV